MISFSNNKQYGKQLLFVDASFQLNPDEGAISVSEKLMIGYSRQDVAEKQGRSVLDEDVESGDQHAQT